MWGKGRKIFPEVRNVTYRAVSGSSVAGNNWDGGELSKCSRDELSAQSVIRP